LIQIVNGSSTPSVQVAIVLFNVSQLAMDVYTMHVRQSVLRHSHDFPEAIQHGVSCRWNASHFIRSSGGQFLIVQHGISDSNRLMPAMLTFS
jgi:hypothetical protein